VDLQLKGQVVLITGGAKGIGGAIARGCAAEGAVPVIVDVDQDAGQRLQGEVKKSGASCGFVGVDLSTAEKCAAGVAATVREFGRVDVLVNNAGINDGVGLEHGSPEKFVGSLQRNLLHYYNMAHYALPELKKSQGAIVNIASKTAVTGQGGTSGYVAAKGGILALTREWAVELLPYNIRVNAVVPAEVMTPLYRKWLNTFPDPDEKLRQRCSF
jgi:NAD(P)-dependent dehydrogenase (short-subunit alcohol dehydrogenase family)